MEGTALDTLLTACSKAVEFSGTCLTAMINNPVYAFFFACGMIPIGLGLVAALKNTARH